MNSLRRKLEKYKSREWMAAGDEVLLEEIKMYRVRTPRGMTEDMAVAQIYCFFINLFN